MDYNEYNSNGNKKRINLSDTFYDKKQRARFMLLVYFLFIVIIVLTIKFSTPKTTNTLKDENTNEEVVENIEEKEEHEEIIDEIDKKFSFIDQNNYTMTLLFIPLSFFLFFLVLIFTEIIELNCFGLSYNTKKNIELRARLDSELNINNEEDDNNIDKTILLKEGYSINLEDNLYIELKNIDEIIPIDD